MLLDHDLLQAKAADGSETHYITSSSSYLRYYASALRSARERAPSLLPVLVVLNDMPQDFIDWVETQVHGAECMAPLHGAGASAAGKVHRQQTGTSTCCSRLAAHA